MKEKKKVKISFVLFIFFGLLIFKLFSLQDVLVGFTDITIEMLGRQRNMVSWMELHIIKYDLLIIALVLGLLAFRNKFQKTLYVKGIDGIIFGIYILYLLDVYTLLRRNTRFFIKDFLKFITHIPDLSTVLGSIITILVLGVVFKYLNKHHFEFKQKYLYFLGGVLMAGYFLPLTKAEPHVDDSNTTFVQNFLVSNLDVGYTKDYNDLIKLKDQYIDKFQTFSGASQNKNIIVLNVESLSNIDSYRLGGLHDYLPLFDEIQKDGIAFKNFMANGYSTDGGLIALLRGYEPIPFSFQYDSFEVFNQGPTKPLPEFMNKLGYDTSYVQSSSLDFLDKGDFLKQVGYENIIGRKDFGNEQRYTFDSPPDGVLYDKALNMIEDKLGGSNRPFFMHILTISSHLPYNTPYGKDKKSMYDYVDQQLYNFYNNLKQTNFFDNGILVILGDHRKMHYMETGEFANYGFSSFGKTPLVLIGNGIPKGKINKNFFQQTDLFYSLKYLLGDTVKLINDFNNIFTNNISRNFTITPYFLERNKIVVSNPNHQNLLFDLNGDDSSFNQIIDPTLNLKVKNYIEQLRSYQIWTSQTHRKRLKDVSKKQK